MLIHEAIKEAMSQGKAITRRKEGESLWRTTAILPTVTNDCCIIVELDEEIAKDYGRFCRRWNPTAEDLMANDWEVTDYVKKGIKEVLV